MSEYFLLNEVDLWAFTVLFVDLVVAVSLIVVLRFLFGLVANVHTATELAERDNFAFGISFSGGILAVAFTLTGVLSGTAAPNLLVETLMVAAYGSLGLVLIKVGRLTQDKLVLTGIDLQAEIRQGNLSA
ncbi:MAG: DUF350 domain-containing protein, partial [Gammaproteobacteria bacterium]|nr:DUF350 domain-containing protein [Gammaproteobacteria bacterium]